MILLDELNKPFSSEELTDFIEKYNNYSLYALKETHEAMQAWVYTEIEKAAFEKERIAKLSLTKREVFLALYKAKGITPDIVRSQITDTEALIEFDYANEYYRFNPLIDKIGAMLGYSSEDLDYLFINKELPSEQPEPEQEEEQ